jgi:hypothetical protein
MRLSYKAFFTSLIGLLLITTVAVRAQVNPAFFIRIAKCSNVKAEITLHDKLITRGSCAGLPKEPVYINHYLREKNNRLLFTLSNVAPGEFYGDIAVEVLVYNTSADELTVAYNDVLRLEEGSRVTKNLDGLLRKHGWQVAASNLDSVLAQNIVRSARMPQHKHAFVKSDKFTLIISSSAYALYSIAINDQQVAFREQGDVPELKTEWAIGLNDFDRSPSRMLLAYALHPAANTSTPQLRVSLIYYRPGEETSEVLMEALIELNGKEMKKEGNLDLTEPLRRKGFF